MFYGCSWGLLSSHNVCFGWEIKKKWFSNTHSYLAACLQRGLRGYIFQKLLLAWNFPCINKKCFLIKETDTFGHIVVWTIKTSHIDHFTPQHTTFEHTEACLSVFLELLPGSIQFTILWHAGWTLEKPICMNMNYTYNIYVFLVLFAIIHFDLEKFISKICKI